MWNIFFYIFIELVIPFRQVCYKLWVIMTSHLKDIFIAFLKQLSTELSKK